MLDDQFISSLSWLPSPRFELRALAGYSGPRISLERLRTTTRLVWSVI